MIALLNIRFSFSYAPAGKMSWPNTLLYFESLAAITALFHNSVYKEDGYILSIFIKSKASVVKFKDAVVKLTFLTETDTEIGTREAMLYKFFGAHANVPFEFKVYPQLK